MKSVINSTNLPSFQAYQQAFCAHIRDPKTNKPPVKVVKARMAVYTEIVFNNLFGSVSACYPVSQQVLGKRRWERLVKGFFAEYASTSPIFRDIPQAFLVYLNTLSDLPIYLPSLAHYEWIELAVSSMETTKIALNQSPDLMVDIIVVNPALALLKYDYAVHKISPRNKPTSPLAIPIYLAVYRTENYNIQFIELNDITAQLLHLLKDNPLTGEQALLQLAGNLNYADPQLLLEFGSTILQDLKLQGILL